MLHITWASLHRRRECQKVRRSPVVSLDLFKVDTTPLGTSCFLLPSFAQ